MEHQIRFQNRINASQTAGPIEGLFADHVGVAGAKEVQQATVINTLGAYGGYLVDDFLLRLLQFFQKTNDII
jgi:hypothetical protein